MMFPILISVSVAPASYFFCANAPPWLVASKITAVENAANRRATKDILFLPMNQGMRLFDRGPLSGSAGSLTGYEKHAITARAISAQKPGAKITRSAPAVTAPVKAAAILSIIIIPISSENVGKANARLEMYCPGESAI
jgi:hypothetical protein